MASGPQLYYIKNIKGSGGTQSIVLQNENGPCALIAIVNVLILRDTAMAACISQHCEAQSVEETVLLAKLGELATASGANDCYGSLFEYLTKLSSGLDVNPKFDGSFAYSAELDVFKAFNIPLYHGWVAGDVECADLSMDADDKLRLSNLSYEQLCEIQFSDAPNSRFGGFLSNYPSQMTPSGFSKLSQDLKEGDLAVLFWNNHFSTLLCYANKLFTLVTDLGFQNKSNIVWEELNVKGAGAFFNGEFCPANRQQQLDEQFARDLAGSDNQTRSTDTPLPRQSKPSRRQTQQSVFGKSVNQSKDEKQKKAKKKARAKCLIC